MSENFNLARSIIFDNLTHIKVLCEYSNKTKKWIPNQTLVDEWGLYKLTLSIVPCAFQHRKIKNFFVLCI